jgi:hypothetical protein
LEALRSRRKKETRFQQESTNFLEASKQGLRLFVASAQDYVLIPALTPVSGVGSKSHQGTLVLATSTVTTGSGSDTMYYDIPVTLWDEVDELESFVQRHLDGRLDAASLKARRVPFGCYEQRKDGAYMLRIRCPGGALTPTQLRTP